MKTMSDQEIIERLKQGAYQGEKIIHVDYDSRTSSICDIWLVSHKRVSFTTAVKALEWVAIDEIIELAEPHLTMRETDDGDSPVETELSNDELDDDYQLWSNL